MWLKFAHFRGGKWEVILMQQEEKNDNKIQVSKIYFIFVFLLLTCNSTKSKSDE
jgi:hypothetical protein